MKKHHICLCITLVFLFFPMSCYYTTQAYYLFRYTYIDAKSVKTLLASPDTEPETQVFLKRVQAIKVFLRNYAHLNTTKTYNSYTELEQDYLVAVVQAAPEFGLNSYMWKYPFLGKLPYRGYYQIEDAQKEAKKLREKNYDVLIRRVRAFSTLNMLPDPLYSFMKKYQEWDLVELIAHEQTHSTIWVSKQSSFNEQLANFVGQQSALDYIKEKYGRQSLPYMHARNSEKNAQAFTNFLYAVRKKLEHLYNNATLKEDEKRRKKVLLLKKAQEDFVKNYKIRFTNDNYAHVDITKYNNAFFATISLYEDNSSAFKKAYEACGNSMSKFIDALEPVKRNPYKKDPYAFLENICALSP